MVKDAPKIDEALDSFLRFSGEYPTFVAHNSRFDCSFIDAALKMTGRKYDYRSIDTVNIGGLPFLPGATRLVEKMLGELVADSEESAFERASLPAGIESLSPAA